MIGNTCTSPFELFRSWGTLVQHIRNIINTNTQNVYKHFLFHLLQYEYIEKV